MFGRCNVKVGTVILGFEGLLSSAFAGRFGQKLLK
jgi:hypothetical protein